MNDTTLYINTEERRFPIVFNLNVMEELQDKYGSMEAWGSIVESKDEHGNAKEPNIKVLKYGLMAMINEGIEIENEKYGRNDPLITSKQTGRILSEAGLSEVINQVKTVTVNSVKVDDNGKNE